MIPRPAWLTNRLLLELALAAGMIVSATCAGSAWSERHHEGKASALETKAAEQKGEDKALKAAADEKDRKVVELDPAAKSAGAQVASAKRELADAIRRKPTSLPKAFPLTSEPTGNDPASGQPGSAGKLAASVEGEPTQADFVAYIQYQSGIIAKQNAVIQAQDGQIAIQARQITALTEGRDAWKKLAEQRQQQIEVQESLAAEYRKAIGPGKRATAIKWGIAGIAVGFLAGKR